MRLNKEQKIQELRESLEHILHYLGLLKSGKNSYIKPLSVELRKLYFNGRGNELLKRIERDYGTNFVFSVRSAPLIPPTYRDASIDEYINEFRFFKEGKEYNRGKIIDLIANKKAAHLDEVEEDFHRFEKSTFLPVYSTDYSGIYPLATKYLIDIAEMTLKVCDEYLKKI
jgi:hypothetical protein